MLLPNLGEPALSRSVTDVFGGYNRSATYADGEFTDMENLSSDSYPMLSPRKVRGIYAAPLEASCLIAKDSLCYTDGTDIVINGYHVDMGLSRDPDMLPKRAVSMGAYLIILPDKKYINTKDLTDKGDIEASFTSYGTVTFSNCSIDGSEYENCTVSVSAPESPENGIYWVDTSSSPCVLKEYSASSGVWAEIESTYIKISSPGIARLFSEYDGVRISGIDENNTELSDLEGGDTVLCSVYCDPDSPAEDYIVVPGIISVPVSQSSALSIKRIMPDMDMVIESENRLWGCKYGISREGETVNEIYASKLGDFKNWNVFMGISTDSYRVSLGTDGQFTGAVNYLGYPVFFKENCFHKLHGSYPANYRVQTTLGRGVMRGAEDSLAAVNEVLYYKSRDGICAYDGSLPVNISEPLGHTAYTSGTAGAYDNKYYISMKDQSGAPHLFVYDTLRRLWHREDGTDAAVFCSCGGELYFIDRKDGMIKTVGGTGEKEPGDIKWMAETGIIGRYSTDSKTVSRLSVKMSLSEGSRIAFFIRYDSAGSWEKVMDVVGHSLDSFTVPIRPRRCDHFSLRILGEGEGTVHSISKTYYEGSEVK